MRVSLPIARAYEKAAVEAFCLQAFIVLLSGLGLDFGQAAQICVMALPAFWAGVLVLVWRRPLEPKKLDLSLIRVGYLPVVLLTAAIAPAIWHARGVL